ncbi:MAG TPA: NAD(P)H-binding protein, partial [Steroidobacteraceae bacterium]|nr:NAD(P)H-binding protein [Steroidobacteraceae bacterium]
CSTTLNDTLMADSKMRLLILGATGSLGAHVLDQALSAGHQVSVFVRDPSKLTAATRQQVVVHTGDLSKALSNEVIRGHDALINCAGNVADGERFVSLIDRVIASVESLPAEEQPVCWFLAGLALLEIDASRRRGIDLPKVKSTYWPHGANFERLQRSSIDWRLLCPGPMVEELSIGLQRLRISLDRLPVELPAFATALPKPLVLPLFAAVIPQMIVPYADAAALMLAN